MAAIGTNDDKWYFTKEQLENTPSRRGGIPADKELSYRQQAATLIQDMGQRLSVSQLTINTSIVYMHRFYMFQPFAKYHRHVMAPCCLFLAAKVEEQPRKLEHVIRVAHACLHRGAPPLDTNSEEYLQQAQDLIENESVLLQSLGFEVTVHHPHTYVVKAIQLVRASKDLGQASYFMATNSLHLTTLCLQYKPPVVACACIHLACKWCNYEIPPSNDNKHWWEYMNAQVTKELLDDIAQEFINIIEKCPSKLKRKINSITIGSNTLPRPLRNNDVPSSLTRGHDNNDNSNDSLSNDISKKIKDTTKNDKTNETAKKENPRQEENNHVEVKKSTITSEGASVATSTTVVTLPVLPPLTTKYAAPATTASQPMAVSDARVTTTTGVQKSSSNTMLSAGSKHKHRSHEDGTPSKKHKSSHHSSRSHSSGHGNTHKRTSSHSSDSSSPGVRHHSKSSSHGSSHKGSSHSSKHHHGSLHHKVHPSHHSSSSSHKLIPPSPTLGLLDKSRLSSSAKPSPPVPPAETDAWPPPPPPPLPPSDSQSTMFMGGFSMSGLSGLPPPPPPEPAPKSPPPPPPPPF